MSDKNERTNPQLNCTLSAGLWELLQDHSRRTNEPVSHIVSRALAEYFQVSHSTLYQVSTATALVEGIYQGAVRIRTLREHGDLGLGTFENLDGEMMIVDGHFFQARSGGFLKHDIELFYPTEEHFGSFHRLRAFFDSLRQLEDVSIKRAVNDGNLASGGRLEKILGAEFGNKFADMPQSPGTTDRRTRPGAASASGTQNWDNP